MSLRACTLAKHISHIEEIYMYLIKENIQRVFYIKNKVQHKIKELILGLKSLVLVKNSGIELSVDKTSIFYDSNQTTKERSFHSSRVR